jgi:CDP-diacylglycerol--serine O-phosphatidyltransferase
VAAVFDFFDGFAARLLKADSLIGKELDSLADVVSFGVAPATVMYNLLMIAATINYGVYTFAWFVTPAAYLITVFSALRLARFNIDTRQSDSFTGLPTPANAIFICSMVFISSGENIFAQVAGNFFFLMAMTAVLSYLLVSGLHLFSLKFKSFDWKSNRIRYVFPAISLIILICLKCAGLSIIILLYIILSIIINQKSKIKNQK